VRTNVGQEVRKATLLTIGKWIADVKQANPEALVDRSELVRKIQLVIGATRKKAEEYCDLLEVY
jgi:hypothetical protein